MIGWLDHAALPQLAYAVACLLLAAVFMTLYGSYRVTQDAGLDRLAEKYPEARDKLQKYEPRWDQLRSAVLLLAALFTLVAVCLVLSIVEPDLKIAHWKTVAAIVVLSLLSTIFIHMLPHALSESYADLFSARFLPVAAAASRILLPIAWPLTRLEQWLLRWLLSESDEEDRPSHEDEILSLVQKAPEAELEEEEREIIKSVFEFGDTIAREVMTPRVDLVGLPDTMSVSECCEEIRATAYSRFPVYHESFDQIIGIVHVKDLLKLLSEGNGDQPIRECVKEITTVPERTPINDVLRMLRAGQDQVALVTDEFGGTEGIISIEDIVEELIGDIHDEFDTEHYIMRRLTDGTAVVDARVPVYEVNALMNLSIPEMDEYDSLGGYIFHSLGRIPRPGEVIDQEEYQLTVQSGSARRLHGIHVKKKELADQAGS